LHLCQITQNRVYMYILCAISKELLYSLQKPELSLGLSKFVHKEGLGWFLTTPQEQIFIKPNHAFSWNAKWFVLVTDNAMFDPVIVWPSTKQHLFVLPKKLALYIGFILCMSLCIAFAFLSAYKYTHPYTATQTQQIKSQLVQYYTDKILVSLPKQATTNACIIKSLQNTFQDMYTTYTIEPQIESIDTPIETIKKIKTKKHIYKTPKLHKRTISTALSVPVQQQVIEQQDPEIGKFMQ
jgi:hypothetical protein